MFPSNTSQTLSLSLSLCVCITSILYKDLLYSIFNPLSPHLSKSEQYQYYQSLLSKAHASTPSPLSRPLRLAFCCSADLDVSVRALDLMHLLQETDDPTHTHFTSAHHERIASKYELSQSFAYYFSSGAAAEQSMSSQSLFREIVTLANTIPDVQHSVGGNAATMAERAAMEGCEVLLGAASGKHMRKYMNPRVQVVGELSDEEEEDVHLVLEYAKNEVFRNYASPRANRYYLNHDIHNARLSVLEAFEQALPVFQPDLVVIGGLQLMEVERDAEKRSLRLLRVSQFLQKLHEQNIPSHYEFAAVSDFHLFGETTSLVLPYIHSIGLNEQELFILHQFLIRNQNQTATVSRPTVAQVTDQVHAILRHSNMAKKEFASDVQMENPSPDFALAQLSRMHFHTLQFHILCQQSSVWEDPYKALTQAALMSTKLACGKNRTMHEGMQHSLDMELDFDRLELLLPREIIFSEESNVKKLYIDPFAPVLSWEAERFQCHLVPMLACKVPDHTAGLGDNISGTGMAYHDQKAQE